MLEQARPDIVHILTPPSVHADQAVAALSAGAHVIVEKPIASTWDEFLTMRDTAKRSNRLLVENYSYRFAPTFQKLLALVKGGAIGAPLLMDVSMTTSMGEARGAYTDAGVPHFAHGLPGGGLYNFASHPASLVTALLDDCSGVAVSRSHVGAALTDDELSALITCGVARATLTLTSHGKPPSFRVTVRGTKRWLEADIYSRRLFIGSSGEGLAKLSDGVRRSATEMIDAGRLLWRVATARNDYFEGLGVLLGSFYAAVEGDSPPLSLEDLTRTNSLVHALFAPENQL
jgi:predicted dehydrogenase